MILVALLIATSISQFICIALISDFPPLDRVEFTSSLLAEIAMKFVDTTVFVALGAYLSLK
ncbi:unnamed protein product [Gemmata massiliana]|uniref:Uncharacterized protein n=1 Tax=Gemmata massiliana TaxID=1210884 RepID=A0A6P2CV12_9BACT|nr:unnamed protein product [Gemmata massiliana]